jgi:phospholipase D1/2
MAEYLPTQNPVTVAIDEVGRSAKGSAQWFLENKGVSAPPPITHGNSLKFLICGQEGFASIAQDIANARETVELICWGFDPAMELVRNGNAWPRGQTYGELLEKTAQRGVKVRLLVWHNALASEFQNNMPGYTDESHRSSPLSNTAQPLNSPYENRDRHRYCSEWWKRHLSSRNAAGDQTNLHVVLRSAGTTDARNGLTDEEDKPAVPGETVALSFATHHQKPVLIDYAYDGGSHAVGYVMGLNSVTDYWDTQQHEIDDALREEMRHAYGVWGGGLSEELAHESSIENRSVAYRYRYGKPYQDYACRVEGPALERLHQNFVRGWNVAAPARWQLNEIKGVPPKIKTRPRNPADAVQIVRTQPHEHEKTIKALYFQAASWGRDYIYIENQYFFYPAFAHSLKQHRMNFSQWWVEKSGKPVSMLPKLHLFIVIPNPERDQMVPRTADTLTQLGHGSDLPNQMELIDSGKASQAYAYSQRGEKGNKMLDRPGVQQLADTMGLQVSVARLRTSGLDAERKMAYREIYIHSKLMLIDDVFVTLGSANMNQRSMAVDSEINIAATGLEQVSDLRERIFTLLSGGDIRGSGDWKELPKVFKDWNKRMTKNALAKKDQKNMQGFLLPFEDHRSTTSMQG